MAKSVLKQQAARSSPALSAWRRACAEYLKGGEFRKIPKKGTAEYNKIYDIYQMELQVGNSHRLTNN